MIIDLRAIDEKAQNCLLKEENILTKKVLKNCKTKLIHIKNSPLWKTDQTKSKNSQIQVRKMIKRLKETQENIFIGTA